MANDVYTQTYDGLATLVSARAAQRVLDRALEAAGQSADTVSGRHMKKLLLGPVCRELETTLPRNGLRRTLKKLAADLTADLTAEAGDARSRTEVKKPALAPDNSPKLNPVEADEEAPASTFFRAPDAVHKERQGEHQNRNWDKQDDEPEEAFAPSAPETGHETASVAAYSSPSTSLPAAQLPVPTQPAPARAPAASRPASKPAAGRKTFPPLAGAQLEAVVLRFAGLEEVKLVASFGPRGEVTVLARRRLRLGCARALRAHDAHAAAPERSRAVLLPCAYPLSTLFAPPGREHARRHRHARPQRRVGVRHALSSRGGTMKRSLVVFLTLLLGWSALARTFAQDSAQDALQPAPSGVTGGELAGEGAGDSFVARYTLAIESLNESVAALDNGLGDGGVEDRGVEDGAASLDNLERAARTLRPLSQDTSSPTLVRSMEATFERARTAVRNESGADLAVQVAVLKGGFRRLLYEAAVRDANAGDLGAAGARFGALASEMGLSVETQDALAAANITTDATTDTTATPAEGAPITGAALRLTFEKGVAAALQGALGRVNPEAGLELAYPALAEAYGLFIPIQDSPFVSETTGAAFFRRHRRAGERRQRHADQRTRQLRRRGGNAARGATCAGEYRAGPRRRGSRRNSSHPNSLRRGSSHRSSPNRSSPNRSSPNRSSHRDPNEK